MARCAADLNARLQDIGARRLHTVISQVTEEVSFNAHNIVAEAAAPDVESDTEVGETVPIKFVVDADYVRERLDIIMREKQDLDKYIL